MSYAHIQNLYKDQTILLFRECYALEKIHGTSAHISWRENQLHFSSGGEKHSNFLTLFDQEQLREKFLSLGHPQVVVFGEAYGGKCQRQSWRYGDKLRFVAFEVKIGDCWLAVPSAHEIATLLGLEFVHYTKVSTDLACLDAERDAPSEQAKRNGVEGDKPREGVVLRPLIELTANDGTRIVAKHKRAEERETATPREVVAPEKLAILTRADEIAEEWTTPTRLEHVLDKLGNVSIDRMRDVIAAMTEDILREGSGEIVDSKEARQAIGRKTAALFKKHLETKLRENNP
jgi:RNA ligase